MSKYITHAALIYIFFKEKKIIWDPMLDIMCQFKSLIKSIGGMPKQVYQALSTLGLGDVGCGTSQRPLQF